MIDENTNNQHSREVVRCSKCDSETDNYDKFISPANENTITCINCQKTIANNAEAKPPVKCDECDTIREHYVTYVLPANELHHVCWSCQQREDKAFNTKPGWTRRARQNDIEAVTEK